MMATQPCLFSAGGQIWMRIRDGNPSAMALFRRHYSCTNKRPKIQQFIGPGEKLALMTPDATALFCWRKERFRFDGQQGVNCTVFRNEGGALSSELIREADRIAWGRWPGERHFTFVNPREVRAKRNPGYCFLMAGWRQCGTTKSGLLIFEIMPPPAEQDLELTFRKWYYSGRMGHALNGSGSEERTPLEPSTIPASGEQFVAATV